MQLTVQSIMPPKPGGRNYSVTATNGERYSTNAPGIEQTAGKTIEAVVGSFQSKAGRTIPTIESFSVAPEAAAITAAEPAQAPFWWPSVSNVWAHAIQAGLIKTPTELKSWAAGVRLAAEDYTMEEPDF